MDDVGSSIMLMLHLRLKDYIPKAADSLCRNSHMNELGGVKPELSDEFVIITLKGFLDKIESKFFRYG